MRALAPCPWSAGGSSAVDGRRPGRTLVARLRQPNHSQSCTKMAQGPCWGRSTFHLLHTGHARGRIVSSMLTISRISHPFGQCVGAIGDVLCLPCGREISTPSAVSLSLQRFPPPHSRLASALRRRVLLDSLCHGEGIFHGLPCLATTDSLGMCQSLPTLLMALRRMLTYDKCQTPQWQGRPYPCQQTEATFDWPSLRPFCSSSFHLFHIRTEETLLILMGLFGCGFGLLWGFCVFCCFFGGCLVFLYPSICCVSYPSTMTWAHRPHGVRARGKKTTGSPTGPLSPLRVGSMYSLATVRVSCG